MNSALACCQSGRSVSACSEATLSLCLLGADSEITAQDSYHNLAPASAEADSVSHWHDFTRAYELGDGPTCLAHAQVGPAFTAAGGVLGSVCSVTRLSSSKLHGKPLPATQDVIRPGKLQSSALPPTTLALPQVLETLAQQQPGHKQLCSLGAVAWLVQLISLEQARTSAAAFVLVSVCQLAHARLPQSACCPCAFPCCTNEAPVAPAK